MAHLDYQIVAVDLQELRDLAGKFSFPLNHRIAAHGIANQVLNNHVVGILFAIGQRRGAGQSGGVHTAL